MSQRPLDNVLSRLALSRRAGRTQYSAPCPTHDDRKPSLSVSEANDGRVLLKCHAGCQTTDVIAALGLTFADLYPTDKSYDMRSSLTLEALSREKGIPVEALRSFGLREAGRRIRITYRDRDGTEARPQYRCRGGKHFWDMRDDLAILPYGLDRLGGAVEAYLVEGASDCWTLWLHELPAIGIPGADMARKLEAEHIHSVQCLFVVKEADRGGEAFLRGVAARLRELDYNGDTFVVDMALAGANDPNDLYRCDRQAFPETWKRLTREATRLDLATKNQPVRERGKAPSVLVARPLAVWIEEASRTPTPRRLFGDCWFEGEVCILFGETNTGKSILAVQVAHGISAGTGEAAGQSVEVGPETVAYFDFELSAKQFHGRYSEDYGHPFRFDSRFLRVELARDFDFEGDWTERVHESIAVVVEQTGARVLIIDNLTALRDETERAKGALPLMRFLNTLKKRYGLSILVLAHTPKRDASRPVTRNDLAGSRVLLDLSDSAFAIGESHRQLPLRYIKQIKVRETVFTLDGENVALLRPCKPEGFLSFAADGYARESDHLGTREVHGARSARAAEWLRSFLEPGPRLSDDVIQSGREAGHSRNALFEAKKELGIKAKKVGFSEGAWEWHIPDEPDELAKRTVSRNGTLRDDSVPATA